MLKPMNSSKKNELAKDPKNLRLTQTVAGAG
jgi:hypothetical protein